MCSSRAGHGSTVTDAARADAVGLADLCIRSSPDRFFLAVAVVMLVVNFVGFAPSYFLKLYFDTPELPLRTHLHGVLFTSWFVLFAVQTVLVQRRHVRWHQRLGRVGALLAILLVLSASMIIHYRALEYDGSQASLTNTTLVVSGNVALLLLFTLFVGFGVLYRRRADWHRRFMLLASLSMTPQSLGRFGRLPLPRLVDPVPNEVLFVLGGLLLLLAAVWVHDVVRRGRLHPVTGFGCPFFLGMVMLAAVALPEMTWAQNVILWLNNVGP
jgi:uncharacterized membrane protein YozB (DUF420 family)